MLQMGLLIILRQRPRSRHPPANYVKNAQKYSDNVLKEVKEITDAETVKLAKEPKKRVVTPKSAKEQIKNTTKRLVIK